MTRFEDIKAFAFDVDGVFTDGLVLAMPDGDLLRQFNSKDCFAVRTAVDRHVGRLECRMTMNGETWFQRGKDLTELKLVLQPADLIHNRQRKDKPHDRSSDV